jgi:hypothetical protein
MTLILLMLILPITCHGSHFSNKQAHVQFDVDDNWQVAGTSPLTLVSPHGDTLLTFDVTKGTSLESALANAQTLLSLMLSEISPGEPQYMEINGIKAIALQGTCIMRKIPAEFKLLVLDGHRGAYGLFYYFGASGHEKINEDSLKAFLGSIKRR